MRPFQKSIFKKFKNVQNKLSLNMFDLKGVIILVVVLNKANSLELLLNVFYEQVYRCE